MLVETSWNAVWATPTNCTVQKARCERQDRHWQKANSRTNSYIGQMEEYL
jgi:hypothetical protein